MNKNLSLETSKYKKKKTTATGMDIMNYKNCLFILFKAAVKYNS